jgi:hypothetical protein
MPEDLARRSSGSHCFRSGFKFYEHSANIRRFALLERKIRHLAGFGDDFGKNGRSPDVRLFLRVENAGCVAADAISVSGRTLAGGKTRFPCRDEEVCSGETPSRNRERVLRRGNLGFRVEISDSTLGRTLLGEEKSKFQTAQVLLDSENGLCRWRDAISGRKSSVAGGTTSSPCREEVVARATGGQTFRERLAP